MDPADAAGFDALGLTPPEARALHALAGVNHLTAGALAEVLDMTEPAAAALLGCLADRGLAVRSMEDPASFVASRPSVALGAVLADRVAQLRLAEVAIGALEHEYTARQHSRTAGEVLDVILGPEAISARLQQIQLGARSEVLSLVKAPVAVVGSEDNPAEDVAVDRGVTYRVVLERSMLEEEPRLYDEILRVQQRGEQVKVATSLPVKLFIVDRELAMVPLGGTGSDIAGALLIHKSGLLDALLALFEAVWRDSFALPVPFSGHDHDEDEASDRDLVERMVAGIQEPDELDLRVLALLMSGLTDQAVASALRVSVRTVQRRVRALMTMARVDSRLQLGRAAAERQWLPSDPR